MQSWVILQYDHVDTHPSLIYRLRTIVVLLVLLVAALCCFVHVFSFCHASCVSFSLLIRQSVSLFECVLALLDLVSAADKWCLCFCHRGSF